MLRPREVEFPDDDDDGFVENDFDAFLLLILLLLVLLDRKDSEDFSVNWDLLLN